MSPTGPAPTTSTDIAFRSSASPGRCQKSAGGGGGRTFPGVEASRVNPRTCPPHVKVCRGLAGGLYDVSETLPAPATPPFNDGRHSPQRCLCLSLPPCNLIFATHCLPNIRWPFTP